jgi:hypothetical protein
MTMWMTCMALLLAISASPLAIRSCYENGYPLTLRIVAGVALVVLAATFPGTTDWMVGIATIGLAGVAPIVVDGLLDRDPPDSAGSPAPCGAGSWSDDGGMGATCATLAATTAVSSF